MANIIWICKLFRLIFFFIHILAAIQSVYFVACNIFEVIIKNKVFTIPIAYGYQHG